MLKRLLLLALSVFLTLGCRTGQSGSDGANFEQWDGRPPFRLVTTTSIMADSVRRLAGERAEVTALVGEGVDPHLYNPTRSDVARLRAAHLVFYHGHLLEGRMGDVLGRLGQTRPVVALGERVSGELLLTAEQGEDSFDPHLWMDPKIWGEVMRQAAAELSDFDPDGKEQYEQALDDYLEELAATEEYIRSIVATVPAGASVLVTAHDAFRYFGRAYGIEVIGIQGLSTDSEAGLEDLNRLVDLLVERQIPAVFVESSVADKNVRALVEGAAARGFQVRVGGELYSDSLGSPGSYQGTYLGMMDHNATTVVRALGGHAPEHGRLGHLKGSP